MNPLAALTVFGDLARLLSINGEAAARAGLRIALIWVLGCLAVLVVRVAARRIAARTSDGDDTALTNAEKRGQTVAQVVRSFGSVGVLTVAVLLTLNTFIDIGPLLAGAGIVGLAISFGAQSLVKDLIAGFLILSEGQFAVGDSIEVAGKAGVVERITLRAVRLRDLHGVLHMIPNGQIATVSNYTRGWSRAVVEVPIGFATDLDTALAVFRDEADHLARDPAWQDRLDGEGEVAGVEALGENGVVVRTLFRTPPGAQWAVAREFRRRLKNRLGREGIEIALPRRTILVDRGTGAGPGPVVP